LGGVAHLANVGACGGRRNELQVGVKVLNLGLIILSFRVNVCEHEIDVGVRGLSKESFPKTLFCLIEAVLVEQRNPQKKMSFRGVWVAIESAANQALGLLRFPPVAEDQAVGKLRVGIMAALRSIAFWKASMALSSC